MDKVSDAEAKLKFENEIWPALLAKSESKPQTQPIGYVLGGQPGAGKSALTETLQETVFKKNPAFAINGDEFRQHHPRFKQIVETHGQEASKYTGSFSATMTEMAIRRAIEERRNIIIEGTFRTAETPLQTLQGLKDAGYETGVAIKTCPAYASLASTVERYETAIKDREPARLTPREHHDITVKALPQNADTVLKSGLADSFVVYSREGMIFEKGTTNGLPSSPIQEVLSTKEHYLDTAIRTFKENYHEIKSDDRYDKHSDELLKTAAFYRGMSIAMADARGDNFDYEKFDNLMSDIPNCARLPPIENKTVDALAKEAAKEYQSKNNEGQSL